jgi:hypothetical protein
VDVAIAKGTWMKLGKKWWVGDKLSMIFFKSKRSFEFFLWGLTHSAIDPLNLFENSGQLESDY